MPEYDEWDRIQPNPSYESRPGVDHTRCTQMNGVCIGWHCANCGESSSSQGHFGLCDPEKVALHQAWKEERARAKAARVRELLADDAPEVDGLVLADLRQRLAAIADHDGAHIVRGEN